MFDDKYKYFQQRCTEVGIHNFIEDYRNHKIPVGIPEQCLYMFSDFYNGIPNDSLSQYMVRVITIDYCGFCLVTENLLDALSSYLITNTRKDPKDIKILELGCGLGTLAYGLRQHGFNVIPVDNYRRYNANEFRFYKDKQWINDIIDMDQVDAVKKYASEVDYILVSWPEIECNINEVPKIMHEINPKCRLIYLGEGFGGCTANNEFFCKTKNCDFMDSVNDAYDRWIGIYDNWSLLDYDGED